MAKVNKAEKTTNKILIEAGKQIVTFSFNTTKNIFTLYKNAAFGALKQSKKLLFETVRLTVDNQKNVVKTANKAFKETVEVIREKRSVEKNEAIKNRKAPVSELTIDDLLES